MSSSTSEMFKRAQRPFSFAQAKDKLGGWIFFQGRQLCQNVCLPSEKRSTLERKKIFSRGANSFLLELTAFQKVLFVSLC